MKELNISGPLALICHQSESYVGVGSWLVGSWDQLFVGLEVEESVGCLCISCFVILVGSVGLLAGLAPFSLVVPFSSFGRYSLNSLVFCCF